MTRKTNKQRIADAAIACFNQFGPQRTSMSDIAEHAGVSRITLYRAFADRPALIEFILSRIVQELSQGLKEKILAFDSLEEALVEGSILSLQAARENTLFESIVKQDTEHSVDRFLFRSNDEVRGMMLEVWGEVFDRARGQGELRRDLDNARLMDLMISVHSLLFVRDDYSDQQRRQFLIDFLIPAMTGRVPA